LSAGAKAINRYHSAGDFPKSMRTAALAAFGLTRAMAERPQLLLATHPNFTRAFGLLKKWRGTPYVSAVHGTDAWDITSPSLKRAILGADGLLSVSAYTKSKIVECTGIDPSRVGIVPNTFDDKRFTIGPKPAHLLQRYSLTEDQPVILTVGRLWKSERRKGHDIMLDAIPLVRENFPKVRYLVAGTGDDTERLRSRVQSEGLSDSVTFAGFVPDDDLCAHYNLCDVYAMPSKQEGFGIVFLESLSCGKPVLAGNKDASVEAVDHGHLGALVDPDDAREIAHTLSAILGRKYPNPVIFQPEALRARVIELFGFERFKANLKRELDGVLSAT
jgi:glycosyltransferase involved in cell wall biosynthesis